MKCVGRISESVIRRSRTLERQLVDDVKLDLRETRINHSQLISRGI